MNTYLEVGENYYSGFQKFNVFADPAIRKCVLAFVPLMSMQIPGVSIIPPGMTREIFFILMFLCYMAPAALVIAGGMPLSGWLWYLSAAFFFGCATIPPALDASNYTLLFLAPSAFSLWRLDRVAPHVFLAIGYKTEKINLFREVSMALLMGSVLILYTWLGQILIRKEDINIQHIDKYLWVISTGALYYGVLWGILYGVLMRRFLDMRFNIMLPILINIVITSIYWIPSMLGYSNRIEITVGGAIIQGLACNMALGATYYFCRTTRPVLAAFIIQYLFLKALVF